MAEDLEQRLGPVNQIAHEIASQCWLETTDRHALEKRIAKALRAERARSEALEKALEPFAKAAEGYDPPEGDDELLAWGGDYITIGMLRSALAALSLKQEGKGNG